MNNKDYPVGADNSSAPFNLVTKTVRFICSCKYEVDVEVPENEVEDYIINLAMTSLFSDPPTVEVDDILSAFIK